MSHNKCFQTLKKPNKVGLLSVFRFAYFITYRGQASYVSNVAEDRFYDIKSKDNPDGKSTVTVQHDNTTGGAKTINFNTAFDNTPLVFAIIETFNVFGATIQISAASKTSFGVQGRWTNSTGGNQNCTFYWIAIDPVKFMGS